MKRGETASTIGWLSIGSPLLVLILLAISGLVMATSPASLLSELRQPDTQMAILISLRTTLISTLAVCVFGTCLSLGIAKAAPFIAATLELIVTAPAIMPPSVAGLALLLALGQQGTLGPWLASVGISIGFTTGAVVIAQILVSSPFFIREATNAFRSVRPDLVDAARLDGANSWAVGRHIILPITRPFLFTGLILAWTRALGEFGATIMFAGNMKGITQTMPLAVYIGFESNLEQAKALAVIMLLPAIGLLFLIRILFGRSMAFAH